MFIKNPEKLSNVFVCGEKLGKYIYEENKIPVLSILDNVYYFSNTIELNKIFKTMPFHTKWYFMLGGEKFE
jgi:hypothetical protein